MDVLSETKPILREKQTNDSPLLTRVTRIISNHILFPETGRTDSSIILEGCVTLSSCNASISGFGKIYTGLPSHTTCLNRLHRLDLEELKKQSSAILAEPAMKVLQKGRSYHFAIDKTGDPYYGEREGPHSSHVVGGRRKASTNYFYTYMTLSIVDKDKHFTLAVIPWTKGMKNLNGIQQCVDIIHNFGLKIKSLCLDREFYAADIFRYLQNQKIPHLVPVKVNSDKLRNQLKGRKSKTFNHILNVGKPDALEITICDCVLYRMGKREKHGTEHHPFVVSGISTSPRKVREIYSHRFSIESSYRMRNFTKAKTTSKNPVIRLFYTLIAFLYQNCWIAVQWKHFRKLQRGPAVIESDLFQLDHFTALILSEARSRFSIRAIEDIAIS
jgi:putative transposase